MHKDRTIALSCVVLGLGRCGFAACGSLSFDGETSCLETEALWECGEVTVEGSLLARTHAVKRRDGCGYSFYDFGQSVAAQPSYAAGTLAAFALDPDNAPFVTCFAVNLAEAVFGVFTFAIIYPLPRRMHFPRPWAMLCVLLLATATLLLVPALIETLATIGAMAWLARAALTQSREPAPPEPSGSDAHR
jgi:hypothetical protein